MAEQIILQGLCNQVKGAVVENGHGMLTNQRFIYSKHSLAHIAVMGAFVNLTRGDFEFDIPLADITEVEETKRLFSKILVIHTKNAEYRFFFTKLEEWKIAFNNALASGDGVEQVQTVPGGSVADELLKFKKLLDAGAITEQEYEEQKAKLLSQ